MECSKKVTLELCGTVECSKENFVMLQKKLTNATIQIEFDAGKSATNSILTLQHWSQEYRLPASKLCSTIVKYLNSIKHTPVVTNLIIISYKNMQNFTHLFPSEFVTASYR